jgi:hypothetical protein
VSREELERFLTDEGRVAVDRLLAQARDEGDDFDLAEVLDRNLYDAMLQYDTRAGLSRWLSLRFTGPRTRGRMAEQAVEDILGALRREVTGASATKDVNLLKLDLVGFSHGSAILHLAPAQSADLAAGDDEAEEQQTLVAAADQLDDALGVVTELHRAAESAGDVMRFSGQDQLLKGFEALADALDKHDLDMGITWRSRTGRRRTAELTSQGRAYARQFLDRSDTSEIIVVTGRVVELSISGSFDVKAGSAPNSRRYKITTGSEDSLLSLHLELGQPVNVRVRQHTDRNKVGVLIDTRYEFIRMTGPDDPLFGS